MAAKNKNQALWEAARYGKVDEIRKHLKAGADINFMFRPEVGSGGACTPLWIATNYGHIEAVKELLSHGADKEKVDTVYKRTPAAHAKKMQWDDPKGIYDVLTGLVTVEPAKPSAAPEEEVVHSKAKPKVQFCNKCGWMGTGTNCSKCDGKLM
eukprot:TRINITY_DN2815_c0_g5_i1.p1 TRINITY_DN2815_c0_g5~~TRINITY_DN2815_c0_g5_i1.p1  ORF type:complete len:153 (+),score=36.66 TRINITY_DN2815_c0_g5_i1:51-509(+)